MYPATSSSSGEDRSPGGSLAAEAGVGIDVASPYETRCALEAGVPPEKLDVNGNSKDDDLINLAISKNMLISLPTALPSSNASSSSPRTIKRRRASCCGYRL